MRSCDVLPKAEDVNSSFPQGRLEGVLDEIDGPALDFASSFYECPQFRASAKHFSHPDGGSQPTKTATTPKYQHTFSGATDRRPSAVGLKAPLVLS